jgi:hypothetical protein
MKSVKPKPSVEKLNAAYKAARARDPECRSFVVNGIEYRLTTMPDAPELAWDVWVGSIRGDILVDKRDGGDLTRPIQTENGGYLYVSIAKKIAVSDPHFRRRVHQWVAHGHLGPPPFSNAIVGHLDYDGLTGNSAFSLTWSDPAMNRARRNGTAKLTPAGKVRPVSLNLRLVRRAQAKTGHRGQRLTKYVEKLIRQDLIKTKVA